MFFRLLTIAVFLFLPTAAAAQPLTIEKIMQEPETWIGDWPDNPRWGETGEYLYFEWNPMGQFEDDSLYRVPREGSEPEKLTPAQRRALPPFFTGWHHGEHVYDADYERKVYAEDGDLFLFYRTSGRRIRLTDTRARESNPRFTLNGEAIIFAREDNLFRRDLSTGTLEQLTDLRPENEPSDEELSPQEEFLRDQQRVLFETVREAQEDEEAREAARERMREAEDPPPTFYYGNENVQQLQISPDGRFVTFMLYDAADSERTQVLDYVTETGYAETLPARPKVGAPAAAYAFYVQDLARDTTYEVDLHQLPGAYDVPAYRAGEAADLDSTERKRTLYAFGPYWSRDGEYAVLDIRARDNKDRWIVRLFPEDGRLAVLDRRHDDAWIAAPGISWWGGASTTGWLPEGERFFFQSEESGFSHLYVVHVPTGEVSQLTSGAFEVSEPRLARDGETWYFISSEASPFERHLYRMPVGGGGRVKLTTLTGSNEVALSPDADVMGILHSYTNQPPEIYLQRVRPASATPPSPSATPPLSPSEQGRSFGAEQVTHSTTNEWRAYEWADPPIIRIPASDGVEIPAQIFEPEEPNGAAVLFVHGAGYLQNVHRWWSSYFREYMFHNLLQDRGYVVLNLDYRGSAGYGRDWRAAIYRHMGGRDLQDYVDASRWLEETRGIPPERVFIYGGSYGGFITLMALFTEPEHFGGGAALRAVTDWAHYNETYTSNILNTPATDSLAYARSSPIYFAEGLEDPLLMAHGVIDRNVQLQDVIRLAQRLIELGKEDWELALYPAEGHGFVEPSSWADEYRRILELIKLSVGPREAALEEVPFLEE